MARVDPLIANPSRNFLPQPEVILELKEQQPKQATKNGAQCVGRHIDGVERATGAGNCLQHFEESTKHQKQ